jgi:hypothetical protein
MKTIEEYLKETTPEAKFQKGQLIPACGGTETPFTIKGYRLLYCWHTGDGNHYYLNLDTDRILSQDEVNAIFCN